MLNYLKKFAVDIFPSVAATVIGAYIVNHYIVTKPAPTLRRCGGIDCRSQGGRQGGSQIRCQAGRDHGQCQQSSGCRRQGQGNLRESHHGEDRCRTAGGGRKGPGKAEAKADAESRSKSADAKPADTKSADTKSADAKSADAEPRRMQPAPREKEKIRVILPSPIQPVQSSAAPAALRRSGRGAAPAAPVEAAAAAPDERRDANDLARAAIERLRANGEMLSARARDGPRPSADEKRPRSRMRPRSTNAPVVAMRRAASASSAAAADHGLGPSGGEPSGQAPSQPRPPYAEAANPNRPTPPADIPLSRPLDLRAEVAEPSVRERATAAAEDALSTAKSIFHAVLPK